MQLTLLCLRTLFLKEPFLAGFLDNAPQRAWPRDIPEALATAPDAGLRGAVAACRKDRG